LYLGDEFSGDLIQKLEKNLANRTTGLPTRFLYDHKQLSKYDLMPGGRYHNFNDFFGFPDPTKNTSLHNVALPPLSHPQLEQQASLIKAIGEKDYILHLY